MRFPEQIGQTALSIKDAAGQFLDRIDSARIWRVIDPDLYSATDAWDALSQIRDPKYSLGTSQVDIFSPTDRSKIWSMSPEILEKTRSTLRRVSHFNQDQKAELMGILLPGGVGGYSRYGDKMFMNDLGLIDLIGIPMALAAVVGNYPSVITNYYLPLRLMTTCLRSTMLRHESIHARHHYQLAEFIDLTEGRGSYNNWDTARTIAGRDLLFEERLTCWQTAKEDPGPAGWLLRLTDLSGIYKILYRSTGSNGDVGLDCKYLSKVWDQIPNYREIRAPADIDDIKQTVEARVARDLNDRQFRFTMEMVEQALRPYEGTGRSSFPQDAYIKGMFTSALYTALPN